MRFDRFTQKMQEAVQAAQTLASQLQQKETANAHSLLALLDQPDGVTPPLLAKMGVAAANVRASLMADLERRPQVHGSSVEVMISHELRNVLDAAEQEMSKLKDEYISAEHYLLALAGSNVPAAKLLKQFGVTRDNLMQALQQVRGSQRVVDQNPEG